jgi:hypothetical protein
MTDYRHQCEVREVLRMGAKGRSRVDDYLAKVEKARGAEAASKLRDDAKAQWVLGNRGEGKDWRDAN